MSELIINARNVPLSTGLMVRRVLPFRQRRMVGPFIFLDHAGPVENMPSRIADMDVLPHPHIGLSTVTYLLEGNVTHRDSLGKEQIIVPGEVNWMTAGKGISHSERFEDPNVLAKGGLEMLQTWVALPEKYEEHDPEFFNYKPHDLKTYTDKGVWMRLIAGDAYGLKGNVKTFSPLFYLHTKLEKNATIGLPTEHSERAIYLVKGSLNVQGRDFGIGQMIVFAKNDNPIIKANEDSVFMLMGGEPLGERFIWWNFVSSRKERIEQAKEDWKLGRIELPPNDNEEYVPLPESSLPRPKSDDVPQPEALS